MKKPVPMLDPKKKNEQNIKNHDSKKKPTPKPKEPVKEDPEKIPESNDPAGYSEPGNIKRSPFKKK